MIRPPVQQAVIEASSAEGDLLVSAQTGSGKTVAYGLAIASTLLGDLERLPRAAEPLGADHRPHPRAGPAGAARTDLAL